ncbi:MAG TPA: DUF2125 domain-containing protein [Bauldia sp.]|nr:DUF2125 domain-containing protein [Bauldia sp.]
MTNPTEPSARERRRRHRGRRFLVWTVIVAAILWCGYWYAASRIAEAGIGRFTTALAGSGRSVSCTEGGMSGFPLRLDLRCTDGRLDAGTDGISAALKGASASALLYQPGYVETAVTGPLALNSPALGGNVTAVWQEATLKVDAGISGLVSAIGNLSGFSLVPEVETVTLPLKQLTLKSGSFRLGPAGNGDYRIDANATDLAMARSTGPAFPPISTEVSVVAARFGSSTGLDPEKTLQNWVAAGGGIRVENLALHSGDISLAATGKLALAPTGYLSGRLALTVTGMEKLPDLAEALKPGSREKMTQVVGMVSSFMKPVDGGNGAREIDLLVQNGVIFAGMFPLPFVIPPVRF